jgi:hypothetical protein
MREPVSEHTNVTHKPSSASTEQPFAMPADMVMVARVKVVDGLTLNMGNYSSFRRDIGLEVDVILPGAVTGPLTNEQLETLDRVYEHATAWVQDRLADAQEDAQQYFED